MRTFIYILTFTILTSCSNSDSRTIKNVQTETKTIDTTKTFIKPDIAISSDTTITLKSTLTYLTVLVLPPYDETANEGISPDIQKYIENVFTADTTFKLIKFPYRRLMNVPYQNIFDKKYCKPITDKIKVDIILMSKINQSTRTGNMTNDKWNFQLKVYYTKTGRQFLSALNGIGLTSTEIEKLLIHKRQDVFTEIKNNR